MVNKEEIAVLITCHNRKEKTIACLAALYECNVPQNYSVDFFLVDDGSTDGTAEAIMSLFPSVNIIQGDGDLFWNRGMNLAWKTASAKKDFDYYLWLNDDTFIFDTGLTTLLESSKKENDHKIVSGTTCSANSSKKITYGGRLRNKGLIIPNGQNQKCDYFNGNIILIPRDVFRLIGFNDVIFHHSLGDFDYGLRASSKGVEIVIGPYFSGSCEENIVMKGWKDKSYPLTKRFRLLYSPQGNNPVEYFKYDYRHNGLIIASFHFLTIHLRVFL